TDGEAAVRAAHLVEVLHRLERDDDVGADDALLDEPEQVAAAASVPGGTTIAAGAARERDGVLGVFGGLVGKCLHASAPRILSLVIGRSFIRRPIALKMALAIAAGDRMMPASPMLFAPYGPYPSSDSMNVTSIGGASWCVGTRSK